MAARTNQRGQVIEIVDFFTTGDGAQCHKGGRGKRGRQKAYFAIRHNGISATLFGFGFWVERRGEQERLQRIAFGGDSPHGAAAAGDPGSLGGRRHHQHRDGVGWAIGDVLHLGCPIVAKYTQFGLAGRIGCQAGAIESQPAHTHKMSGTQGLADTGELHP